MRRLSLILTLIMLLTCIPVHAADAPILTAFGDSIAYGYGLDDPASQAYPALIAKSAGAVLRNHAVNGQTSAELLTMLRTGAFDEDIRAAAIITLSIGSNDILRPLLSGMTSADNMDTAFYTEFIKALTGRNDTMTRLAEIAKGFGENFRAIIAYLREKNPGAVIAANNLYNPYAGQSITAGNKTFRMSDVGETWIAPLNAMFPVSDNYVLVDIHSTMNSGGLTNARIVLMRFDPHPTQTGAARIASTVCDTAALRNFTRAVFRDVETWQWHYPSASWATRTGVVTMRSSGRYYPNTPLTRGAFVTMLGRAMGTAGIRGDTGFSDVPATREDAPYIRWAVENGITDGVGGGRFAPDTLLTREQLCTLIERCLKNLTDVTLPAPVTDFTDADRISGWAKDAVGTAAALGLVVGDETHAFHPSGTATRAQLAAILLRLTNLTRRG